MRPYAGKLVVPGTEHDVELHVQQLLRQLAQPVAVQAEVLHLLVVVG